MLLQTTSKPPSGSPHHLTQQLSVTDVTRPDSVELALMLNEIGVLHYLQNNTASVSLSPANARFDAIIFRDFFYFLPFSFHYTCCSQHSRKGSLAMPEGVFLSDSEMV